MPGILYNGKLYTIPGVTVLSPGDEPWVKMSLEDYALRPSSWIRQITLHKTLGDWPMPLRPGKGPIGRLKAIVESWKAPDRSAAPIVIGSDGVVACLHDIGKYQAFHATKVNPWSVGIETSQEHDNSVYEAAYQSETKVVLFLCNLLGIPLQGSGRIYHENGILQRLKYGGPDVVGVYGHRDNAWDFVNNTSNRGKGDPGEESFIRLNAAGKLNFNIDAKEEITYWKQWQQSLNSHYGEKLSTDGICGPGTVAAMRRHNVWNNGIISAAIPQ